MDLIAAADFEDEAEGSGLLRASQLSRLTRQRRQRQEL